MESMKHDIGETLICAKVRMAARCYDFYSRPPADAKEFSKPPKIQALPKEACRLHKACQEKNDQ